MEYQLKKRTPMGESPIQSFSIPKTLGRGFELLVGGENITGASVWSWVAMLYPLDKRLWLCGLSQAMGEIVEFDGPPPLRVRSGSQLFEFLVKHWQKYSGEQLMRADWDRLARDLQAIDPKLSDEFGAALASRLMKLPEAMGAKPKRVLYKASIETLDGLEERLDDVKHWTQGPKRALKLLHQHAREENLRRRGTSMPMGPHELLELKLFSDPNKCMSENAKEGRGFSASLMDGPQVDIFQLAGIDPSDELHDSVWDEHTWQTIFDACKDAFCVEVGDQDDRPGMSDVFYWVCVTDPAELARQLREFIISNA